MLDHIVELAIARAKKIVGENDIANAFAAKYANELRYVAKWGQWFAWENGCWREDTTLHTYDRIRRFCESSKKKPKAQMVAAIERLAKADRRLAATHDQWDTDVWLLNTPEGVVDLRTGAIRPVQPEDYMTKITAVGPDASCSTAVWTTFLDRITGSEPDLIAFHHRFFGYALTGVTREHAMGFGYGTGANGKSVETNTIAGIMGDYHTTAPLDTFTATMQEHHPTDLAGLRGARLVTVTEVEEGRRWAEGKIKTMTGGDKISARFMRQDFFEYIPQFKLWVAGNHKPRLRNVDEAMRRRLHLVPFARGARSRACRQAQGGMARHPTVADPRLSRLATARPEAAACRARRYRGILHRRRCNRSLDRRPHRAQARRIRALQRALHLMERLDTG
jgi:putative DNA primase/helicase